MSIEVPLSAPVPEKSSSALIQLTSTVLHYRPRTVLNAGPAKRTKNLGA